MNILNRLAEILILMARGGKLTHEVPESMALYNGHPEALKLGMWTFTWDDGVSRVAHYGSLSTENHINHLFELVSDRELAKIGEYVNRTL